MATPRRRTCASKVNVVEAKRSVVRQPFCLGLRSLQFVSRQGHENRTMLKILAPAHDTSPLPCRLLFPPILSPQRVNGDTLGLQDTICDEPDSLTQAEVAGIWIGIITGLIAIVGSIRKLYQWCEGRRCDIFRKCR